MIRNKLFSDILYLQGEGNYTKIHFEDGTVQMSSYTLKKVVSTFSANHSFLRIHRAYFINKDFVEDKIENTDGHYFKLTNGVVLPVSRSKRNITF
jgi:two-component system LytT family response regulator